MLSQPSSRKIWSLSLLTLGLYFFYWCSRSRAEINRSAGQVLIPSSWYLVVPGLNYFWMWLYAGALQKVSYDRIKSSDVFLVYLVCASLLTLPFTFGRGFNISSPPATTTVHPSWHTILVIISVIFAISVIINAAGMAFFCNYTQANINALPRLGQPSQA